MFSGRLKYIIKKTFNQLPTIFPCNSSVPVTSYCYFNPNPCGWGHIWLPKLWTGITPQWLKLWTILKLMYSLKNISLVYLVKYFSAIYKPKCVRNRPFLRRFCRFRAAWRAYFTSMTPSTTTPGLGTPPANRRRTKQFWSHPHGL